MDLPTTVERWSKVSTSIEDVECTTSIARYNYMKWFIDEKRSIIAPVMFPFRARRPFRAKGYDMHTTFDHDMYLWHKHLMSYDDEYTFKHFLMEICAQVKQHKSMPTQVSEGILANTLILHRLESGSQGQCRYCHHSYPVTFCPKCPKDRYGAIHLCKGLCMVLWHNKHMQVQYQ